MLMENQIEKLRSYYHRSGTLPTYDEMRKLLSYKSKSTAYYLMSRLVRAGVIRRKNHKLLPGKNFRGLPYFQSVRAGFPGPAEEEANDRLSLDQFLIDRPLSTILIRVKGDSMVGAGILPGDIAIVERSGNAKPGDMVVVNLEGEFTVKILRREGNELILEPANPNYPPLPMRGYAENSLVGIVRGIVRKFGLAI
jgi:repressor LexA